MITQVLLTALVVLATLTVSAWLGAPLTAWILRVAQRATDPVPPVGAAPSSGAGPSTEPEAATDGAEAAGPAGTDAAGADPGATTQSGPDGALARGALRGGRWIGVLERVAVTGTILAGFPAGIAVVVAVKGLGRFPELKENPSASERFVIGSLASLVWAAALGLAGTAGIALVPAA